MNQLHVVFLVFRIQCKCDFFFFFHKYLNKFNSKEYTNRKRVYKMKLSHVTTEPLWDKVNDFVNNDRHLNQIIKRKIYF